MGKTPSALLGLLLIAAFHAYAAETKPDPEVVERVEEGARLLKEGKLAEAGEIFLEVLSEQPESTLPVLGLLKVSRLYAGQDQADKAIEWLDRTAAITTRKAELHIAAATVYIKQKKEAEAIGRIREAMKADPGSPRILSAALTCLAKMDKFDDESREIAERLLATDSAPIDAYLFLSLWHENNGKLEKARKYLLRAIRLDTNSVQGRLMLGKLYEKMEKYDLAEREYIKMTNIVPQHFGGYLCLAELYRKMGKEDLARDYAQKASKLENALLEFEQQTSTAPAEDNKQKKPD